MEKKIITLNNGVEMPVIGYGVYQVSPEECERCVLDAIGVGYRSIDTAQAYYNEEGVGRAWRKSGVPRDELFITTKIWISHYAGTEAAASIDESLRKLQTDYIDLLLLHQCFGDTYNAYRAMEDALRAGKVRAIGVSNFMYDRFVDIAEHMDVKPAMTQNEAHVFCQQKQMRELAARFGTAMTAWSPFAEGQNGLFTNPILTRIGEAHGKTAAQVALRFLVQLGIVVIPKTTHRERMEENLDIFDFCLTDGEMAELDKLDQEHGLVVNFDDKDTRIGLQQMLKQFN
ncbi:aldo/keto reductase [Paraprevotella clara]|uniref:aldo/keto reductase n=1 Tax=Paraprevotella clara TaxID=454154 RepID=UPI003FF15425